MKNCENCEGYGWLYSAQPRCNSMPSVCCGACYEQIKCEVCDGVGAVYSEEEDF